MKDSNSSNAENSRRPISGCDQRKKEVFMEFKDLVAVVAYEYESFLDSDKAYRDAVMAEAGVKNATEYLSVLLETLIYDPSFEDEE